MSKILIIDDSPDALAVAKARLEKENLQVVCAEGGIEGLDMARREKPDLILLDVDMPDLSGLEVCRSLKSEPDMFLIPILFLSGSSTAEDKARGLDMGAVDYVSKPFDVFELRARVRAALRTKHLQDLLTERALLDPLTGMPNRRALMQRLHEEWARSMRHGRPLSFIMADIDHFKEVNDTYGHGVGDRVLQEVATTIARQCREMDMAARYGGEEFAIIVPEQPVCGAAALAERCRQAIESIRMLVGCEQVSTTASFGISDTEGVSSHEALIQRADAALYRAKNAGRNTVEYAEAMSGDFVSELARGRT